MIALTATATPLVQDDIVQQLGMKAVRYIHGFRRTPYWRVFLTAAGRQGGAAEVNRIDLPGAAAPAPPGGGSRRVPQDSKGKRQVPTAVSAPSPALLEDLRSWRREESRKRQVPAFTILQDRVLAAIAAAKPKTEADLLAVTGLGSTLVHKYGQQILTVLRQSG